MAQNIEFPPFARANLRLIEFQDSLSHHSMKGFSLKPNRIRRRLASSSKQHLAGVLFFGGEKKYPVTAHHQHTKKHPNLDEKLRAQTNRQKEAAESRTF
jgi:hypothetical protein